MVFTVYPIGQSSGFNEESAVDSDLFRLIHALGGRMKDFVVDPFTGGHFALTTSASSYDVDVAAGDAFVNGHLVRSDAATTKTLTGSTTNHVWLVVRDAAPGNATIVTNTDGATPSGAYTVKLWEVTTDASGVTGTTDFRPYVAFREDTVESTITGRKTGEFTGATVDATGVQTVSVSFDHPYITATDTVVVTLNQLSDTSTAFAFIRAKNKTPTGFDIEYSVDNPGASGSTASFDWVAHGE